MISVIYIIYITLLEKKMTKRIILASKSPRRKELLGELFENFDIITSEVDESLPEGVHPSVGVEMLAIRKGAAVKDMLDDECLIISSDTLVELDGVALGKPEDSIEAGKMLRALSGRGHNVHTGVAVHYQGRVFSGVDTTEVFFRPLGEEEIEEYIATGEPMDKAGAYGIQGGAGKFVTHYEGDFDTVVGMSMRLLKELLERAQK